MSENAIFTECAPGSFFKADLGFALPAIIRIKTGAETDKITFVITNVSYSGSNNAIFQQSLSGYNNVYTYPANTETIAVQGILLPRSNDNLIVDAKWAREMFTKWKKDQSVASIAMGNLVVTFIIQTYGISLNNPGVPTAICNFGGPVLRLNLRDVTAPLVRSLFQIENALSALRALL